ncbi:class III signal peptide-containing protein [Thermococcus nautili]|uniref:Class III signal peptide n=1 Tax=Thermococcus nautili TaxID=195522 RepID=W8NZY6_9EURY|nr:class III signal peptide-containing protein [Thermococcus nautili]AHL22041.1 hypothetical protein BD01_0415 [Thermococcus nautili]
MNRRAQGAIEYLFMIALSLVVLVFILKKFLDPRVGTVKKIGNISNGTSQNINSSLNEFLNKTKK